MMGSFFASLFIWWRGCTLGTYLFTLKNGIYIGSDDLGNKYFKSRKDEKRWVLYEKDCDASSVSPIWYGWLHGMVDQIPSPGTRMKESFRNMTGTPDAYHPNKSAEPLIMGYTAWDPKN